MHCPDLDSLLYPYLDGELVGEAKHEIEAHLATCAACARRVDVERVNASVIKAAVSSGPRAPDALKQRISQQLRADAGRQVRIRWLRVGAAAASVAVVLFAAHHQYRAWQLRLYTQDAALRHARQFPLEITQPQAEVIEAWFGGKLDHPVSVPRFPNATAAGARLLQVRDKQAAYIRYDAPPSVHSIGLHSIGLFVFGDERDDVDVGSEPAFASTHGFNVVSWREGDVVYQLVTDLDESDVKQLLPPRPFAPAADSARAQPR